ncbi:MAG: hypothetical protein LBB67_00350 [Oscillospiraceae bacterium]|nr:hypothetical protein [Oscillospiraceae bacterium]
MPFHEEDDTLETLQRRFLQDETVRQDFSAQEEAPATAASALPLSISAAGLAAVEEIADLADEVLEEGLAQIAPIDTAQLAKRARTAKRTASGFFYSSLVLLLLLTITIILNQTAAVGVFGLHFYVEQTTAMDPVVPLGSLMITKTKDPAEIKAGDVITFEAIAKDPSSRLTRIVDSSEVNAGMYMFRTKRVKATADSVLANQTSIKGVKIAVIPKMGYILSFIHAYSTALAILAAALCVAAVVLRKWSRGAQRKAR